MKIAAIQICAGNSWPDNQAALQPCFEQAREAAVELIVLPENVACYGGDYRAFAEQHSATVIDWCASQARHCRSWLIVGSVPLATRPDGSRVPAPRVRSAQLLFAPDGTLRGRYDKLHLFDAQLDDAQGRYAESDVFEAGAGLLCSDLDGRKVGSLICYDLRFPLLAQALRDLGAELLVVPSAFTEVTGRAHWQVLLRARAIENGCFVLGVNQCGRHSPTRHSHGHSMLLDPWGRVLAALDDAPGVLLATLDLAQLHEVRKQLPVAAHQRLAIDVDALLRSNE